MAILRTAALQPINILALVAAIFGGVTLTIWWLPLGVGVYAIAVWLAARDPLLTAPPPLPRPRITSSRLRAIITEIERSQREVERTARAAQGPIAGLLSNIVTQTRDLVMEAYFLADKGQMIERYLANSNEERLSQQIQQLDWQISATIDTFTRQQLEERRQSLQAQRQHIYDLANHLNRIQAQLANIDASLDTTLAEIVRLRAADAVAMASTSGAVQQRLADLRSDMEVFRKVLDTAMTGI
ncbi:hypothetical protein [Chloroflexus sp.]|uniref:hypothetical protein n=1 Tax=Chloroflexus sp. TaxID=1904827 RepID=UPI00261AC296|nr:hypothetical protein [uncultured Chloroflexus sp.]